ncbi:DsrE family protein [Bacillus canaveralius]|uniref:DsrE family protein n=1 Tax=Bacillus canaveralius TaxID=1403243 RepID=A0A2N5GPZ1_9BACI|nr:DsrE family protein [Bacillus canaveralius]PLR84907.1 DsrE family protein [Bacillus canaveralius]PLR95809.1 DsrE family protein [Bacillus canaveralius]
MKYGIIIETKEPEKSWNAFRFANASLLHGHEVKVFLMGEGVECEGIDHEKYNTARELNNFIENDGVILACGTCIQSRKLEEQTVCPISTMKDCIEMVEWADKVITF